MRSDLEELLINSMKCLDEDQVMSATWQLLEEEYSKYEILYPATSMQMSSIILICLLPALQIILLDLY